MTQVRRAVLDDAEAIARTHVTAWQQAYAHVVPATDLVAVGATGEHDLVGHPVAEARMVRDARPSGRSYAEVDTR